MSFLKNNYNIFLPVIGLVIVVIFLSFIDTSSYKMSFNSSNSDKVPDMVLDENTSYTLTIITSYGEIEINLFENYAPKNVNYFIYLAKEGFYNDLSFHRIIPNFIIQTGELEKDLGYRIEDEVNELLKFDDYTVAMANEDKPNTNSSQFFITLKGSETEHLDGKYTIIGIVTNGFDVVEEIGNSKEEVFIKEIIINKDIKN